MSPLPLPQRRSTPKSFYTAYLPELWRALVGDIAIAMADAAIVVDLRGDTSYVNAIADGKLTVRDGADDDALARFACDLDSWRIAVLELVPRLVKRAEQHRGELRLAERLAGLSLAALHEHPGHIDVVYEDDAGDRALVEVTLASGGPRRARIEANDTELWRLLDGGGRLSQLVTSRVRVSGDVAYVLELARLFERE